MHPLAVCRDTAALQETRQLYAAMIKAARRRGPAGKPCLQRLAMPYVATLSGIAEVICQDRPPEAEVLFREALLVCPLLGCI